MDHDYEWLFSQPSKKINVNMKNFRSEKKVFDAHLSMVRKSFTKKELLNFQAFILWLKRAPFFIHPDKIKNLSKV